MDERKTFVKGVELGIDYANLVNRIFVVPEHLR